MMNFLELMQPQTDIITPQGSKAPIKTLFDHGYNIRNKMVIYDDDPRVEAVMKAALDRHQGRLKDHEEFLKKTEEKQQYLNDVASRHSELKKHQHEKHREEMRQMLDQQMVHREQMKHHEQSQRKAHYATHFGPEPEDEAVKKQRRKDKAVVYKESLLSQIKSQELNTKQ